MTTAAEDSTTQIETDPAALALDLDRHRAAGATVGLVPTMGALHDGHVALIERAAAETDLVVVSIFVNPLQFGEVADLDRYPRTLEADTALSGGAGAAVVFAPSVATMYPDGFATTVHVAGLTDRLEGAHRPGHFDGVTTVVAKLLAVVGRCRTYFGEKDFQQLQVVRRMVADLALPVEIVGCPTVRELDGLARSSRNARLTPAERAAAPVLHRALQAGAGVIERDGVAAAQAAMRHTLATEPLVATDYAEVVDPTTLQVAVDGAAERRFLVAARMGQSGTRLIDNL